MAVTELVILFALVALMGAGVPGPGDASLIGAGTLAGEGHLSVWVVLGVGLAAWMVGSLIGFWIGNRKGRRLLDHPGRLEEKRRRLLARGDDAFAKHNLLATIVLPAFVSGIFHVRFYVFVAGAFIAGVGWVGMYVLLSYFLGAEIAHRIGNAGTKGVIGVVVIVVVGLVAGAGLARWRARRETRAEGAYDSTP